MSVLVRMFVTTIIQSSSATTVMVVGFVNAGLMTLAQAVEGCLWGKRRNDDYWTNGFLQLVTMGTDCHCFWFSS